MISIVLLEQDTATLSTFPPKTSSAMLLYNTPGVETFIELQLRSSQNGMGAVVQCLCRCGRGKADSYRKCKKEGKREQIPKGKGTFQTLLTGVGLRSVFPLGQDPIGTHGHSQIWATAGAHAPTQLPLGMREKSGETHRSPGLRTPEYPAGIRRPAVTTPKPGRVECAAGSVEKFLPWPGLLKDGGLIGESRAPVVKPTAEMDLCSLVTSCLYFSQG